MSFDVIQISAGSGPVEVREFVALLAQRFERSCIACGLVVCETVVVGSDNAPASVELWVAGGAVALLHNDIGVHQLIARSSRRGRAARKRWFASVTVHAQVAAAAHDSGEVAAIREEDLVVTATRAGGKGGQHVNKVSTAVRVQHIPSGITVRAANERSQRQNVHIAMERIASHLKQKQANEHALRDHQMRRTHLELVRGNPVRSYRLTDKGELDLVSDV